MFQILHFILSCIIILILAILISNDRKKIRFRYIIQLLIIEILFAYYFLNSDVCLNFIQNLSSLFNNLLVFAAEGTNFVFGNMNKEGLAFFFLNVLCPIIFISTLIGIMQYIHLLSFIIRIVGGLLSKINGMGKLESFNAVSSIIFGQSENFLIYKNIINKLSKPRIYTMATTAMSTASISIVGAYITMLAPKYVIVALILNIFSTFIVLSLINPYIINKEEDLYMIYFDKNQGFFEMLEESVIIGFKIAIIVMAMLIGFIPLMSFINSCFKLLFGISFQDILGYVFFPFAWMIGVIKEEALQVGKIMAIKLISNEFIAMIDLQKITSKLSPRSIGITSVFLVSFANFSSIGIIIGTIKGLDKRQGSIVSSYGLKLFYGSILINMLSAAVTGLVI